MEASLESHELLLYTYTKPPLNIKTDILLLVLICDFDLLAAGLEIVVGDSTKFVMIHRKGLVEHTINIIFTVVGRGSEMSVSW